MPVANASLLDEGTAAAEAMHLCHSMTKNANANTILISQGCHPQTIDVVKRRAEPLGITVNVVDHETVTPAQLATAFAVLLQYPGSKGRIHDFTDLVRHAHDAKALVIVATDLLSLTLLKPPGEWGADVVVGNSQRFGVPLGFGGPHAAFMATKDEFKRSIPGRLVGVSIDSAGRPALRLALQTREQHIRREKATSNICTAQVLLAVMASMYAVYHGPKGLVRIAQRTHRLANVFATGLARMGLMKELTPFFDTVNVALADAATADQVVAKAREAPHESVARVDSKARLGVSFDENDQP